MSDLIVSELPPLNPDCFGDVRAAFSGAVACVFVQGWRTEREKHFRPATVRVGTKGESLWVFAELSDDDIFNSVTTFNEPAFERGDVFEMFFQPEGQPSYFEFHVTPENAHLQLRFHHLGAARESPRDADPLARFKVDRRLFESWTVVEEERRRWSVLARVPVASLMEGVGREGFRRVRFSFCRYDYTRGISSPVLSSTSPHAEPDFHRVDEWQWMVPGS